MNNVAWLVVWWCFKNGHDSMGQASLKNLMAATVAKDCPAIPHSKHGYRIGHRKWYL